MILLVILENYECCKSYEDMPESKCIFGGMYEKDFCNSVISFYDLLSFIC